MMLASQKLVEIGLTFALLCVLIVPTKAQDINGSNPAGDQQVKRSQLLENLTFDDAACILSYMRFSELYAQKEQELRMLLDAVYAEQDTVLTKNGLDTKLVADYYAQRHIIDPRFFDEAIRSNAVKDFFNIAFYRLIYTMAFEKVMYLNQDSEELLLFKNLLTPRAFDEAHSWIQVNHSPIRLSDFPSSVQEKAVAFAKQLTFDESIAWLLRGSIFVSKNHDVIYTLGSVLFSAEDVVSLNQAIRVVLEQQELPEHRVLARFLHTDQEVANGWTNSKLLSDGLAISSKNTSVY